eukprot:TRINITY_DN5906_c0_g2_i1.p1 TRINITY_DN5906_c0_g2~~TRINITY_DN5906_c0_g2_i1.p1  ORF type:complete len:305 (+),score=44.88 TRINITY_DN5906_c0_g2_i1:99-1013(+)
MSDSSQSPQPPPPPPPPPPYNAPIYPFVVPHHPQALHHASHMMSVLPPPPAAQPIAPMPPLSAPIVANAPLAIPPQPIVVRNVPVPVPVFPTAPVIPTAPAPSHTPPFLQAPPFPVMHRVVVPPPAINISVPLTHIVNSAHPQEVSIKVTLIPSPAITQGAPSYLGPVIPVQSWAQPIVRRVHHLGMVPNLGERPRKRRYEAGSGSTYEGSSFADNESETNQEDEQMSSNASASAHESTAAAEEEEAARMTKGRSKSSRKTKTSKPRKTIGKKRTSSKPKKEEDPDDGNSRKRGRSYLPRKCKR